MKLFFLFALVALSTSKTSAQGGSDILYEWTEFTNVNYFGKEVKLDFRVSKKNNKLIGDTVKMKLFGQDVTILEHRKKGADYWYYADQSNECLNCDTTKYVLLNRAILLERPPRKLKFKIFLDFYSKEDKSKLLFTKTEDIVFDKEEISGIFVKL